MRRYVISRLAQTVITLVILATVVFVIVNVLPGNPGRSIYGGQAPEEVVQAYNERLGVNDPLVEQYARAMKSLFTLDYGDSWKSGGPVSEVVRPAFWRSLKLAFLAMIITVPISIVAGRFAARRRDTLTDRAIVTTGLGTSSLPEFVTGTILLYLFTIKWKIFPTFANPPDGANVFTQLRYLFLPAISMAIVYFGYIARMTRAGVINALNADYTRTATMKGLSDRQVMNKHVMRNALGPTIAVVAVQAGYLLGGLVMIETVFNYNGLGTTLRNAVTDKDMPVLQASIIIVGLIYMLATIVADLVIAWLNPRVVLEAQK